MRLLQLDDTNDITITKDITKDVPRYAILSHTWGSDEDEITFKDIEKGISKNTSGYKKIKFCGKQAKLDGLDYFWVDTCCIDKSSSSELQEAINSMFAWYRNASHCYVFLSDVSVDKSSSGCVALQSKDEATFRNSRWFTRGWTLQELIAPTSVVFFSVEGYLLGDKVSLSSIISEITGIPKQALLGGDLAGFTVPEKMAWAETRQTTRPEDKAYSLLGIFGVHLPLIYSEGWENARSRLMEQVTASLKGVSHQTFSLPFGVEVTETQHFVGRTSELDQIHKALRSNGDRRTVILQGLGGIGKTQLAIMYAKRFRDAYSAVLWLNIKNHDSVKYAFRTIAKRILRQHGPFCGLGSDIDTQDTDIIIEAVKNWLNLANNTRWLMVFDNYDTPIEADSKAEAIDITQYLPDSYISQGCVLITTQSPHISFGQYISVTKLKKDTDCLEILIQTSGREELANDQSTMNLIRKLDGLPLALATAGAYLHRTAISISDYLRLYESSWQLTWYMIQQENELSAQMLQFWAYFSNQDIWFELLKDPENENPDWLHQITEDEISFHQTFRLLCDYGLAEPSSLTEPLSESQGYSIHSCVHAWTVHIVNINYDDDLARLAITCIGRNVPMRNDINWWRKQQRLKNHIAEYSISKLERLSNSNSNRSLLTALNSLGILYTNQGEIDNAEKVLNMALARQEQILGTSDKSALETVNSLGIVYRRQGRLDEARLMYERALREMRASGDEEPATIHLINNIASLNLIQGKLIEAQDSFEQAREVYRRTHGPDSLFTIDIMANLGIVHRQMGRLDLAEEMHHKASQAKEQIFGLEHPSTINTMHLLACTLHAAGKQENAEEVLKKLLPACEKVLGPSHPDTLVAANLLKQVSQLLQDKNADEAVSNVFATLDFVGAQFDRHD